VRLGLNLGYWSHSKDAASLALARDADRLGFDSVWVSEAYGSDAVSVLGALTVTTERIAIGSAVMQVPGRTAANTAMTAATLDVLSGGRFRLGLGVSGPQVSEGWHGVRFDRPGTRLREYVDIVRLALSGERVAYAGSVLTLPLPDGPGVSLPMTIRPVQEQVPVYLATLGPKNLEMTGEIADGWLGVLVSPEHADDQWERLSAGRLKSTRSDFDRLTTLPTVIGDDIGLCRDALRPWLALYVGGMGSREMNFYYRLTVDLGFESAAEQIQDRFLGGDRRAAAAAVPDELIDMTCLVGPVPRVMERLEAYERAGFTTVALAPQARSVDDSRAMLEAVAPEARSRDWLV
jgi:F420-dependent oxidoreductase-like protein